MPHDELKAKVEEQTRQEDKLNLVVNNLLAKMVVATKDASVTTFFAERIDLPIVMFKQAFDACNRFFTPKNAGNTMWTAKIVVFAGFML